jgi:hypothetical protein
MTIIKKIEANVIYKVKESYQTIKKRVATSDLFLEVTLSGQKVMLNKTQIDEFGDEPKKEVVAGKEKKNGKKSVK